MRVRYDHLLIDDGDSVVDGFIDEFDTLAHYRGTVRPMQINSEDGELELDYGLCVDVYFSDAWWEGVILDRGEGCKGRLVFFPDSGFKRRIINEKVRVSRDWNDASGCWSRRGKWLFLELIEEKKERLSGDLSEERIWFCVKGKKEFCRIIVDWTCGSRSLWDDLVTEVIREIYQTTENDCDVSKLQNGFLSPSEEIQGLGDISTNVEERCDTIASDHTENLDLDLSINYQDVDCDLDTKSASSDLISCEAPSSVEDTTNECMHGDDPSEVYSLVQNDSDVSELHNGAHLSSEKIQGLKDISTNVEEHCGSITQDQPENSGLKSTPNSNYKDIECDLPVKFHTTGSNSVSCEVPSSVADTTHGCKDINDQNCNKIHGNRSTPTKHATWLSAIGTEMLPRAEYCPDALKTFLRTSLFSKNLKENNDNAILSSVMKHLSCMGWRVEFKQDEVETKSTTVFRYIAPDGVTIDSPLQACQHYFQVVIKLMNMLPGTRQHSLGVAPDKPNHDEQGVQEAIHVSCGNDPVFDDSETRKHTLEVVPDKLNHKKQGVREVIKGSCSNPLIEKVCCEEARDSNVPKRESPSNRRKVLLEPEYCPQALKDWIEVASCGRKNQTLSERAQKHLLAIGFTLKYITKGEGRQELRYTSPWGKTSISLVTACIDVLEKQNLCGKTNDAGGINSSYTKNKEHLQFGDGQARGVNRCQEMQLPCKTRSMRPPKRGRHVCEPNQVEYTPKTVLSCLIDNNVVLIGTKVFCRGVSGIGKMVKGLICREGIKCECCNKVFSRTKFEAHAGVSHISALNITLVDGRSLLQCQKKIAEAIKLKYISVEPQNRIKIKPTYENYDSKCSVCCYGGELVLCDQCPSAFHSGCLGLDKNDLPEGQWFCPCCRCGICNQSDFEGDFQQFTKKSSLCCDQCKRDYHFGCISQKRPVRLENFPQGNWFCSEKCEQIFMDLHKLLGKPITVGNDSLTWTMLKFSNTNHLDEATIEHYCKLNVALSVMHECFEPISETHTKKDLIEDVIFNKRSDLNRLNFSGFYTILLERDEEVISVATVRIYGANLAEIPLVSTRFQHRRRGMCRILIDVLEKKLAELGVERLILPAIPQTLHTWTTTFGFSKMTSSDRLKFLQYTFLTFPNTIMCQKILRKAPEPLRPTGHYNQLGDEIHLNDLFSEEIQAVNSQLNFFKQLPDERSFRL